MHWIATCNSGSNAIWCLQDKAGCKSETGEGNKSPLYLIGQCCRILVMLQVGLLDVKFIWGWLAHP